MVNPLVLVTSLELLQLTVVVLLLLDLEVDVPVLPRMELIPVVFNKLSIGSAVDKLTAHPLTLEVPTSTQTPFKITALGLSTPTIPNTPQLHPVTSPDLLLFNVETLV